MVNRMALLEFVIPGVVIVGSGFVWWRIVVRLKQNKRALPFHPSRLARWGLPDLLMTFLLITFVFAGLAWVARLTGFVEGDTETISARDTANSLLVLAFAEIIGLSMALVLIGMRVQATPRDFGWTGRKYGRDIHLGLLAFLAISVPTLLIQALLVQMFPAHHPLIEILLQRPTAYFFLVGGFAAVLAAPVAEELLLRVLLQGWLEAVAQRVADGANWVEAALANDAAPSEDARPCLQQPMLWPILVSSACFSALHLGQGPAPIALFVFALGLGYLYQSTHRVLPCIIVHLTLNGMTMVSLWLQSRGEG